MKILFAMALLAPFAAHAAPIDGTWKTDVSTMKISSPPEVFKLKDGVYTCASCKPSYSIKADGTAQPVAGRSYSDAVTVQVVDANNVIISGTLAGKPSFTNSIAVSADGKTMTMGYKSMMGAEPVVGSQVLTREGKLPKGEHAISGKWDATAPATGMNDASLTVVFTSSPDGLQQKWNGQTYDAKYDGKQVPMMNDPGQTMVSIKKVSDHKFVETDYRKGKKVEIYQTTIAADGKSAAVVDTQLQSNTVTHFTMQKVS